MSKKMPLGKLDVNVKRQFYAICRITIAGTASQVAQLYIINARRSRMEAVSLNNQLQFDDVWIPDVGEQVLFDPFKRGLNAQARFSARIFSEFAVALLGFFVVAAYAGGTDSTLIKERAMPNTIEFTFGNEYTLRKNATQITLTHLPQWRDAQSAPPADFDMRPATVTLNEAEFTALWQALQGIDFNSLRVPGIADFTPSPPDMNQHETLRYVLDGITVVNWHQENVLLRAPLRAALADLTQRLSTVFTSAAQRQTPSRPAPGPRTPNVPKR